MREALVKQLHQSEDLNRQGFNFAASPYFQKYTNTLSMQGSARGGGGSSNAGSPNSMSKGSIKQFAAGSANGPNDSSDDDEGNYLNYNESTEGQDGKNLFEFAAKNKGENEFSFQQQIEEEKKEGDQAASANKT